MRGGLSSERKVFMAGGIPSQPQKDSHEDGRKEKRRLFIHILPREE